MKKWIFPYSTYNDDYYKCKAWIPTRKHYKKARFRKAFQRGLEWDKKCFT